MKKSTWTTGPVLIVIAAILWGIDGILRRSLFDISPIIIVFMEHLIGSIIIFPFMVRNILKEHFTYKEKLTIVWLSFFSGVMGTLWFTTALQKTSFIPFSVVFLLQKLQPVFATSTSTILLKERLTYKYLFWSLLAILAAFFVTFPSGLSSLQQQPDTLIAALYAIAAAFAWGSSTAFSKYSLIRHSQTTITGLRFILASTIAFIGIVFTQKLSLLSSITPNHLTRLILITLSTGMVALWIYYKGLKQTQAKISTIVELAFPLTAVVIDIFLYQNILETSQYIAAAILLFAIYQTSKQNQNVA